MFCMGNNDHENLNEDSTAKKIQNYIFKYEDLLGKGNFGSAYCGYDVNTGKQVAIKVIKMSSIKSKISQKLLENQIEILRSLKHHPNILKCCDVFTSVNNCYIITELCDHDLQKQLQKKGKFKEHEIRQLVYGIYKGLEQLTKNSIIHRDIKISNIFLTKNGIPKIADFGFAIKASSNFKDLNIGSPLYMSPQGLLYNQYGPKTDVWSFGILLYELVNGETPLQKCVTDEQLKNGILQPPRFVNPISIELKQVIEACLTVDQFKRPTIFQLANYPYFRKLISQIQNRPLQFSLKQSSHKSTTDCSQDIYATTINPYFFKKQLSYENSVSLLHYCRLLHKINKRYIKSQILAQFLLNVSLSLSKSQINPNNTFNEQLNKLKQVLHQYYNKFLLEHQDNKTYINPRDVLMELNALVRSQKPKQYQQAIEVLDAQTKILIYSIEHQNPDVFTKNSEAKATIDSNRLGL